MFEVVLLTNILIINLTQLLIMVVSSYWVQKIIYSHEIHQTIFTYSRWNLIIHQPRRATISRLFIWMWCIPFWKHRSWRVLITRWRWCWQRGTWWRRMGTLRWQVWRWWHWASWRWCISHWLHHLGTSLQLNGWYFVYCDQQKYTLMHKKNPL